MDDPNERTFHCDCRAPEHELRFTWDDDPEWGMIVQTFMQKLPLWRRIRNAWLYVVHGKLSDYGHFETTLISPERTKELAKWMLERAESKGEHG